MITYNIEKNGFQVNSATNGEDALLLMKEEIPSLAIFDWMIPAPSGLELCKIVRRKPETSNLPIIMLTAKEEEEDRVRGLDCGADDYITKPFSPAELIARIKALLRRSSSSADQILEFEDIKIVTNQHKVYRGGARVHLGPLEYKLLKNFLENPGRVFSREQLLDSVWGHGIYVEQRTVDTHIRRLRKAVNLKGKKNLIRTIRATGYSIDKD
ncbi:MAG: DNA-binding response regulator [Pelagibacteraceae bacterium TMED65]|nr:DNA-binding response regulator [Rickettsiales bacterium]OUU51523.1 MAG: DNA-binding response regulator [Pelagibacteraceae bacterium TMED65]